MELSIIVLNYKSDNLVKQCLKNIADLNLQIDHEVIVVDNNSKDNISSIMREHFPQYRFIQSNENKGMGAGNNVGFRNSRGKYILILNPDVVVFENSIEKLLELIKKYEKIGCVAPKLIYPNKNYQSSRYRFPTFFMPVFVRTGLKKFYKDKVRKYLMEDIPADNSHPIDWARGSALLLDREIFERVGGFDERFFMYLEDTDLCRSVWNSDYEVWYEPNSQMAHYYSRESNNNTWFLDLFRKMAWVHIFSWFKYFWKWRRAV